jgi:acyl-coenzyme A synthetase/AMP-(fatty) acid ligase
MSTYPLVFHTAPEQTIAWRHGAPVTVRAFLADVARLAAALPEGGHVFNLCQDRYRFAVGLCAALVAQRVSLLPSSHTPDTIRRLRAFAPDTFCLHDLERCTIELPLLRYPEAEAGTANPQDEAPFSVPQIDADRTVAYLFTSGSTGAPVPHRKRWGELVSCLRTSADRLGLFDGRAHTLLGTVPAQHMYGFETTVLLPLISGNAFSHALPFYPADVRAELGAVPEPRVLVTSPIHLRALLAADQALPPVECMLSATAPLPPTLAQAAESRFGAPLLEIYGSTETGQIATRRTAQEDSWRPYPGVRIEARASTDDDPEPTFWVSGGHVETPVPMGDQLELLDDGRFLLHGRKADLVNIAGKRTSIAYLNHQLETIEGIVDGVFFMPEYLPHAHETDNEPVVRLAALVVAPTLTPARLLQALRERIDAAFLPRPLVFIDALPRNAAGKLPRAALMAQLARPTRDTTQAKAEGAAPITEATPRFFTIPADHPALPGHFPGHPVVPGVVLLDHAIEAIGATLNRPLHTWRLQAAKFLSPARPGEKLELAFDASTGTSIRFTVRAGQRDVASGTLSPRINGNA